MKKTIMIVGIFAVILLMMSSATAVQINNSKVVNEKIKKISKYKIDIEEILKINMKKTADSSNLESTFFIIGTILFLLLTVGLPILQVIWWIFCLGWGFWYLVFILICALFGL